MKKKEINMAFSVRNDLNQGLSFKNTTKIIWYGFFRGNL